MMPLDVQARGPDEQLLLDRNMVGEKEPSGDARTGFTPVRERPPQQRPRGDRLPRGREDQGREQDHQHSGDRRRGLLRHPVAFAIGLIALLAATPAAYLYWDYADHFEATDDAYIAARQFAIAPEVSGYVTAVLVTDNEHVAAGGVIARIDDRTYRAALARAQAQVAAAWTTSL